MFFLLLLFFLSKQKQNQANKLVAVIDLTAEVVSSVVNGLGWSMLQIYRKTECFA